MTKYEIEKDIAMPEIRRGNKYPFGEMEIGDSFAAEFKNNFCSAASIYGKKHNKKFTIRKMSNGIRCWRIA